MTDSHPICAPLQAEIEALKKRVDRLERVNAVSGNDLLSRVERLEQLLAGSGDSPEDGTLRQQCENNSSVESPHRPSGGNVNEGSGKVPTPQPAAPGPSQIHDAFERARIDRARAEGANENDPALKPQPYQPSHSRPDDPLAGGGTAGRAQYNPAEPQGVEHRSAEREQAAGNLACAREIDKKLGAALAVVEAARPIVEKLRDLCHTDPITCAVVGPALFKWDEALRAFDAKGEK
jgi:hypothetical protein